MKLVIDIPEEVVTAIQNGQDYRYDIHTAIAQGTPVSNDYVKSLSEYCSMRNIICGNLKCDKRLSNGFCSRAYPCSEFQCPSLNLIH